MEGRDQVSGQSFIHVGQGPTRGEDIYLRRESSGASDDLHDFVAEARNLLPAIITDLLRRRSSR